MSRIFFSVVAVIIITSFLACKKTSPSTAPPIPQNQRPFADAGPDQTISLPADSCELQGKGKDLDGTIVKYQWSILAHYSLLGKEDSLDYTTQNVKLKSLQQGWYRCALTVTDNGGLTATDEVFIWVGPNGCPCYPDACDPYGNPCDPWDY